MQVTLSRQELRRRLMALCGFDTNGAQAPQAQEMANVYLQEGQDCTLDERHWVGSRTTTRGTVGIDQRWLNYPTGAGPGDVIAMAVWDDDASEYVALHRRPIGLELDDEPLVEEGGTESEEARDQPSRYQQGADQIEIWPRPDQEYQYKIDHTVSGAFTNDASECVADAWAILYYAQSRMLTWMQDTNGAALALASWQRRVERLARNQHAGSVIRPGYEEEVARAYDHVDRFAIPNSGAWPSVMES